MVVSAPKDVVISKLGAMRQGFSLTPDLAEEGERCLPDSAWPSDHALVLANIAIT